MTGGIVAKDCGVEFCKTLVVDETEIVVKGCGVKVDKTLVVEDKGIVVVGDIIVLGVQDARININPVDKKRIFGTLISLQPNY